MSEVPLPLLVLLAQQCIEDSEAWFGDQGVDKNLPHHALAMAGEVGEFCNLVKKIERGSLNFKDAKVRYDLSMELTDVFIYVLNLAGMLRINLEESFKMKRGINSMRFMKERAARENVN